MEVIDANVLLYAVNEDSPHFDEARGWLDGALNRAQPVGFTWVVLLAFLRLATHPRVFPKPLSPDQAFDVVETWLQRPSAVVLHPTERHLDIVRGLVADLGTASNLVNDAHLAAIAVEHGAEIVSFDGDFARFPGVRWRQPRAASAARTTPRTSRSVNLPKQGQ